MPRPAARRRRSWWTVRTRSLRRRVRRQGLVAAPHQAIRAASRRSHAELDEAEELDRGNPAEPTDDDVRLARPLPEPRHVGSCCGTDHEHIAHIGTALGRAH